MKIQPCTILGVDFFSESFSELISKAQRGGLVLAPSGPGMASDLPNCEFYRKALDKADLILPDSGLMCLWQNLFTNNKVIRISGLRFLETFLNEFKFFESSFWVMPDSAQSKKNISWIKKAYGYEVKQNQVYIAPIYSKVGHLTDTALLSKLQVLNPSTVFIQLGGGVQERLGLFLKENLKVDSTILCTGAALAFLSREQAPIPKWVDKYYLGWLMRCIFNPKVFFPRYMKAFRLIYLLMKYGKKSPKFKLNESRKQKE